MSETAAMTVNNSHSSGLIMVTMMRQNAINHSHHILTAAMDLVSITLGFRMMSVAAVTTAMIVVTMIMFFTIAESFGYPRGNIHSGTMNIIFFKGLPKSVNVLWENST